MRLGADVAVGGLQVLAVLVAERVAQGLGRAVFEATQEGFGCAYTDLIPAQGEGMEPSPPAARASGSGSQWYTPACS